MSYKPPRLLAVFAVVFVLALPLLLAFAPDARAQSAEEITLQAIKFYEQKRYTEAAPLFRQAAEQGNFGAQAILGMMYAEGKGVRQDDKKAAEWYRKAAEQGESLAQMKLGWMYLKGKGVKQDYKKAAEWYRKAAEQGYAVAQYNLGLLYEEGKGVRQDDNKAIEWFHKSAEQGDANALNNLSVMYIKGHGVKKDMPAAYALLLLAVKEGYEPAREKVNIFKKILTAEQIMAGQKIAREWEQRIEANR